MIVPSFAHLGTVLLFVFLVFMCFGSFDAAQILAPPEMAGYFDAPGVEWIGLHQPNVTGTLVLYDQEHPDIMDGHIVVVETSRDTAYICREVQAAGAIGVILADFLSDYPGVYELYFLPNASGIHIPVVQIGRELSMLFETATKEHPNQVLVNIGGDSESSVWRDIRHHSIWIPIQIAMAGLCLWAGSLATAKLIAYVRLAGKPELSIPQMCFAFEVVANSIRLVFWAADPVFLTRKIFTFAATQAILTITHPAMIASTLLIALYWHELIRKTSVRVRTGLSNKMKIPFVVIVSVLFILEIICGVLRGADIDTSAIVLVTSILESIVCLATAIYFFVISSMVVKQLKASTAVRSNDSKDKRSSRAASTTNYVITTGVLECLFVITMIMLAIEPLFWNPYGFFIILTLKELILIIISLAQIMTFRWPPKPGHTSTGNSSSLKKTETTAATKSQEV